MSSNLEGMSHREDQADHEVHEKEIAKHTEKSKDSLKLQAVLNIIEYTTMIRQNKIFWMQAVAS